MKKLFRYLVLTIILFMPIFVNAKENSKYVDKVYDIVNMKESKKVTIYFFHSEVCHHCINENKYLDMLEKKYKNKINIVRIQVYNDEKNHDLMEKVKKRFDVGNGVPFTVIGDKYFLGFSTTTEDQIKQTIDEYINGYSSETIKLPLLGKVNLKKVSIPLVAIILGLLDGFNPCAMWILLFLINMLFNMKDRKKMWILGLTFLGTSAIVYFLAMLGFAIVIGYASTMFLQKLIAIVAIIGGLININSFIKTKNDGCHVVDEKKRKKYFKSIKKITMEDTFTLALASIMVLAVCVNLVELACSAGFPAIFVSLLEMNNVNLFMKIVYLLIYIVFFLIDDVAVFVIAMKTLEVSGFTTKYNRMSHLIGGLIMLLIGILLVFKPEWVMLNF